MVIINFANKWELIITIRDKKIRINSLSDEKKSRKNTGREKKVVEKFRRGKILSPAKNLVTFPRLCFPR